MNARRRLLYILLGPAILALITMLLSDSLTRPGALAVGTLCWMIFWWVTRPVHIAVTGMVPVFVNALMSIVPMGLITSQYSSDSIILIFGSGLITLPWTSIGLDRRIALKALSIIGPSMKSQIAVWLTISTLISTILPNVAVCALLTPIAVSMLAAAGYKDIPSAEPAVPILLAIGWGVGLGGTGTPLGGAMNVVAISLFEDFIGHEFMYIDWIIRVLPYMVIATLVLLAGMILTPMKIKSLEGTKEYFQQSYRELGPMKHEEKVCATMFLLAVIGAFTRPFYATLLPGLSPAFVFLILGCLGFFIPGPGKEPMITWEQAQKHTMWGMMILFGGGLAIGKLINEAGASTRIAEIISSLSLDGGFLTIVVFVVFARAISELTNSTTAAAITVPIVLGFTEKLGLNVVPYFFMIVLAYNAEFVLPISVRAIPVAYGLDAGKMLKRGLPATIINMAVVILVSYACMKFWPAFSQLS